MYTFDDFLIDEEIINSYFCCNLEKCCGACCTFPGEFGAPLKDEEIDEISNCLDAAKEYLSIRSLKTLEKYGFYEGKKGKHTTVCINKRDCVFVYYEKKIAFCSLERAYLDGKTSFKKPISCHLFPIRVKHYDKYNHKYYLYYEKIDVCKSAIDNGRAKKIKLSETLKESIERAFGKNFAERFIQKTNYLKNKHHYIFV